MAKAIGLNMTCESQRLETLAGIIRLLAFVQTTRLTGGYGFSPAAYANERAAKAKVSICALSRGGAVLALVADSGVAVAGLQRGKRVVWRA